MKLLLQKLFTSRSAYLLKKSFHSTCICESYEGDGKTTVTVLNNNFDYGLMIDHVSEHGFILNNGIRTIGPTIIFPKTMISWNIASSTDMNEDSLSLLLKLEPKPDILVIGLDDEYPYNSPFLLNLKDLLRKHKILSELLPVYRACSTFNFLNSENRYVTAALIPPRIKYVEDLLLKSSDKISLDSRTNKNIDSMHEKQNDPLIPTRKYNELNAEVLAKEKEITESFKVRLPWKEESKTKSIETSVDENNKNSREGS